MVREAEENAESDAKAKELIEAKNSSDAASHSINKDYEQYKDQLTEEERTTYETAKTTLDEAMAGDNVETIKEAMNKLFESASPVMTKKQQAESAKTEQPATEAEQTVNAEFKEVDPTEKK
jgi:molecular chaperone DnaK